MSPPANPCRRSDTESIRELQLADLLSPDWNEKLVRFPEATIFHTTEWARVLQDSYGYTPNYFQWHNDDRAKFLCLAEVNSWLTGRRATSLPFADEAQPLGISTSIELKDLLLDLRVLARDRRWKRIEIRGVPEDWAENTTARFYTHDLDLTSPIDALFRNCTESTRRAVRKAERSGIKIEITNELGAIEEYFELHCLTRRKHGVPPQPRSFFQNIHRHLIARGLGFTALAKLNGQAQAGAVFFIFGRKAIYKFGASNPAADSFRPSNLVMWCGIKHLAQQGATTLAFGRTDLDHEGLRRYKLGWGAKEKVISYLQFDPRNETYLSGTASSRSNFLFRILPSWTLKRIGSALYPHIG